MILTLLDNATVANGKLLAAVPAVTDTTAIKQFGRPGLGTETKLRAAVPNGSVAFTRTVLICTTSRNAVELVEKVVLTNVNWQKTPTVVLDPSSLWFAIAPGNGTWNIGGTAVTISGDSADVGATGATNGLTGVTVTAEKGATDGDRRSHLRRGSRPPASRRCQRKLPAAGAGGGENILPCG